MADTPSPLVFDLDFAPRMGAPETVAPGLVRVTAPNAGPYTFKGTNSLLIGGPASLGVVDPGPDDDGHRRALLAAIGGRRVEAIVLTHTHRDHSAGAEALAAATGAPIWFAGAHRLSRKLRPFEVNRLAGDCDWDLEPARILADGETFRVGGVELVAIATPGHCANHMCFGLQGTGILLSGDHVMGWNSTLVAVPDGSMADYLASLEKLIALPWRRYVPAHGGEIADGPTYARALLGHRLMRNRQIVEAVGKGARTLSDLLAAIYPSLAANLKQAASMTLAAHLEYLEAEGQVRVRWTPFGPRLSPA